ncbi:hypothetical protein AVAK2825_00200 [Acidovorax sp. SUPP2825]|nr:hypothetical protein AVAK2825_00200 [Acidovorax sp. SUPP2825]
MSAVLSHDPVSATAIALDDDAAPQPFDIRPVAGAAGPLGAEVVGLDLSRPLGAQDFDRIHRAHLAHHVLVFRDQRITPRQHIDFSRRFGPLQIHVLKNFQLADHPEILIVSNIKDAGGQPIGLGDAGHYWHSDLSYKEKPSLGSLLHAQELPGEGGDTLFADQHAAYDALPLALKNAIAPLSAEHIPGQVRRAARPQPLAPEAHAGADRRGGACGASGGAHPPRNRPQGALRERALHHAPRRLARR